MPFVNCAIGGLSPFIPSQDKPWNRSSATHLFRRLQLGAYVSTTDWAVEQNPVNLVNDLVNLAKNLPLANEPEWAFWQQSDYPADEAEFFALVGQQRIDWIIQWVKDLKNNGLRDRMSFFWHNHFVTDVGVYQFPSWMYQYHHLLQKHALGNFKDFVREMGLTPAMLIYLDGFLNNRFEPNENYARELYEIFTLGVDNGYTQEDIAETARALTGYNDLDFENLGGPINFTSTFFDPGQKTIFGRTGNWGYDDVIDILFEERAVEISEHICGKLYRHFVNPLEDEQVITDLAQVFRDENFEIAPVMKKLFASEHFFDKANYSTIIPGHIEHFLMFMNELNLLKTDDLILAIAASSAQFGQAIFSPVNVAGWPGNRLWITSGSFIYRSENIRNILFYIYEESGGSLEFLRDWLIGIVGSSETDVTLIVQQVIDFLFPKQFQFNYEYEAAVLAFKSEVPENYFTDGTWNLQYEWVPFQVFYLLDHLALSPEFQLK